MDDLILPPGEKGDITYQAQSIIYSTEYRHKLMFIRQAIESCADCLCKVSGIDRFDALTCALDAAASFRQDEKKVSPSLCFLGSMGTGKTQCEEVLQPYTNMPSKIISAIDESFATVRDKIIKEIKQNFAKTIFIEEVDACLEKRRLERFIASSYDRKTADKSIKRHQSDTTFEEEPYSSYAFYVEHRRNKHLDAASVRRSTIIRTEQIPNAKFPLARDIEKPNAEYMGLITDIALLPAYRPDGIEGGIWNNWEMRIQIASALQQMPEWINSAVERMKQDSQELQSNRSYEPRTAIFKSLIYNLRKFKSNDRYRSVKASRIVSTAKREFNLDVSNMNVKGELLSLKLDVHDAQGVATVFPTDESLNAAAWKLGLDNEFLSEVREYEPPTEAESFIAKLKEFEASEKENHF